jgi:hypothetical protein
LVRKKKEERKEGGKGKKNHPELCARCNLLENAACHSPKPFFMTLTGFKLFGEGEI